MSALLIPLLFAFIALGVPISFSLGLSSLVFFLANDVSLATFVQKTSDSVDSFPLLALPFFILAGNLMNTGGMTRRLFKFTNAILGGIRGGLSYVCIASNVIFSALSGSSLANAAGLGTVIIKAMEDAGYDKEYSTCLTASAALLGPIIPPSVIMIVYGITAGVSIRQMFMGGILPGLLYSLMLAVLCIYMGKKDVYPKTTGKVSLPAVWEGFKEAVWALLTPVIILGGIFTGVFTATESGAIASIYAVLIGLFIHKDTKIKDLGKVLLEAGKTTGSILFICATAACFGFCLTYARVPHQLAAVLVTVIKQQYVLLLIFMVVYLFLGCIMSASAIVITTIPIFLPLCTALNIDLVYFGVFVGILMSIGTVTPPVGTVMFVLCKNTGIPIERFAKIMVPWFALMALFTTLLVFIPQIITFLPTVLK
jgi:tripartite ATP-independent transporter DctM subunit